MPILEAYDIENTFSVPQDYVMCVVAFKVNYNDDGNIQISLNENIDEKNKKDNVLRNHGKINRPNTSKHMKDFKSEIIYLQSLDRNKWLTYTEYEEITNFENNKIIRLFRLNSLRNLKFSGNLQVFPGGIISVDKNTPQDSWTNWFAYLKKSANYKFTATISGNDNSFKNLSKNNLSLKIIYGTIDEITEKVHMLRSEFTYDLDDVFCSIKNNINCPYPLNKTTRMSTCMNWNRNDIIGELCRKNMTSSDKEISAANFCSNPENENSEICDCINAVERKLYKDMIKSDNTKRNISKYKWFPACLHENYLKDSYNSNDKDNMTEYAKNPSVRTHKDGIILDYGEANPPVYITYKYEDEKKEKPIAEDKSVVLENFRNINDNSNQKDIFDQNNIEFTKLCIIVIIFIFIIWMLSRYKNNKRPDDVYNSYLLMNH